jgi:Helix-turn-helix
MRIEEVIGQRLTLYRGAHMSQELLGKRLGAYLGKEWTRQAVSHAEHGRRDFRAAELVALAKVIGVPVARLMVPPEGTKQIELGGQGIAAGELTDLFLLPEQWGTLREGDAIHQRIGVALTALQAADELARQISDKLYDTQGNAVASKPRGKGSRG